MVIGRELGGRTLDELGEMSPELLSMYLTEYQIRAEEADASQRRG